MHSVLRAAVLCVLLAHSASPASGLRRLHAPSFQVASKGVQRIKAQVAATPAVAATDALLQTAAVSDAQIFGATLIAGDNSTTAAAAATTDSTLAAAATTDSTVTAAATTSTLSATGSVSTSTSTRFGGSSYGGWFDSHGNCNVFGNAHQVRRSGNGIVNHGGPIMAGQVNIHLIWYGNWTASNVGVGARSIVTDYVDGLGSSSYYKTNLGYWDANNFVCPDIDRGWQFFDSYSQTNNLPCGSTKCDNVEAIVTNAIAQNGNNPDPNAIYIVMASPDVQFAADPTYFPNGVFCVFFCAFHNYFSMGGKVVKYAYVGTPTSDPGCYYNCALLDDTSIPTPNGNPQVEAAVNNVGHEILEAVTDPQFTTWFFDVCDTCDIDENAHNCEYNYGQGGSYGRTFDAPVRTLANGAQWNTRIGQRKYLSAGNWVNDIHPVDHLAGYCDVVVPPKWGFPQDDDNY